MINLICGTILRLRNKIEEGTFMFMIGFGILELVMEGAILHDILFY